MDFTAECESLLKILAENLTTWLQAHKLSNRAFAGISKLSESSIRSIKKGQKNIEIKSLVKLRLIFSIDIIDLFIKTKTVPKIISISIADSIIKKNVSSEQQRIGKAILNAMKEKNIKPEELSILTFNTDYSDTLKYLKGEINITLLTVLKFSASLKVDKLQFLQG